MNDIEIRGRKDVELSNRSLKEWHNNAVVINYGMIIICRKGTAQIRVNFSQWELTPGAVITLFPNDAIIITEMTGDFSTETLKYSASLLREASLQLEQTVYSQLKLDRCRTESKNLTNIINSMFSLLKIYFDQTECTCLEQLVLLQLKAFFVGFYDYLYRNPEEKKEEENISPRTKELFNTFMMELENRFKQSRDVYFYANILHITPKYLNTITQRMTDHTVKTLINQYVILQIKLSLNSDQKSIKEIAWDYHFSDLSFFCRYFKQHTGMTPMQFTKSNIE